MHIPPWSATKKHVPYDCAGATDIMVKMACLQDSRRLFRSKNP